MGNGFDKKAQKSEKRSDFYYRMFRWKKLKSLGQAFLKACRIQKDRVLCLQAKPRFMLFHGCKNVPVLVVPRSGTQKMILKKEKLRKIENEYFAHCDERPETLSLDSASLFSGRFTYPHRSFGFGIMQKKKSPGEKLRVKEERKMDLSGGSRCYDYSRTWWKKVSEGGWGKLELCDDRERFKGGDLQALF